VSLGIIPYYMFVERDTGSKQYFEVPLVRAYNIYKTALSQLTGILVLHVAQACAVAQEKLNC
jgi:L-lysine 2,3-aminomutase